jgi:hypothetical protein
VHTTVDGAALQYESEWEEEGDGDEDAAAQVASQQPEDTMIVLVCMQTCNDNACLSFVQSEQARGPHTRRQGVRMAHDGVMPPNPAISITVDNQVNAAAHVAWTGSVLRSVVKAMLCCACKIQFRSSSYGADGLGRQVAIPRRQCRHHVGLHVWCPNGWR